jgi:hypothetical protein
MGRHEPAQYVPVPHRIPHPPQFSGSLAGFTHFWSQHNRAGPQGVAHPPLPELPPPELVLPELEPLELPPLDPPEPPPLEERPPLEEPSPLEEPPPLEVPPPFEPPLLDPLLPELPPEPSVDASPNMMTKADPPQFSPASTTLTNAAAKQGKQGTLRTTHLP